MRVAHERRAEEAMPEDGWVDRFSGKLVLVLLDNKHAPSIRNGRSQTTLLSRNARAGSAVASADSRSAACAISRYATPGITGVPSTT